jgi:hypothetical protein
LTLIRIYQKDPFSSQEKVFNQKERFSNKGRLEQPFSFKKKSVYVKETVSLGWGWNVRGRLEKS